MLDLGRPTAWTNDEVGQGTHCAGIIVGGDARYGIRGIAPRVKLTALKTFPVTRCSDVIEALERCIAPGVEIIAITLGTERRSALVEQKIAEARHFGIACIAAAGDSSGPLQYPASSPSILTVSAIGWRAAFPSDSHHTQAIREGGSLDGYFTASFSCPGPEVDVCGPGVAIVSTVPPDNFAA